jgi:hypothetical protein
MNILSIDARIFNINSGNGMHLVLAITPPELKNTRHSL